MAPEIHQVKEGRKPKSSNGEKKRKRENGEDGHKSTSKKHRSEIQQNDALSNADSNSSPFHVQTSSLHLPLAPISQKAPLQGFCAEHLSPLILTYYPPFSGVILSYHNPRLAEKPFGDDGPEETLLKNIDEYAVSWAWLTAEFLIFRAEKGAVLEGYVNLQNQGHLGLVCWNLFNASIESKRLPKEWTWRDVGDLEEQEGENAEGDGQYAEDGVGCYVDENGEKVEGVVKFRVKEIESSHDKERGFLSIEGTLLSMEDEAVLVESEAHGKATGRESAGKRLGGLRSLGATSLGVEQEKDLMDTVALGKKSRRKY